MSDPVPPRPDGMHAVPAAPIPVVAGPGVAGSGVAGRPKATWSWWEGLAVYVVSFVLAGIATVPILSALKDDENLGNIVSTAIAAVVIVGVLLLWLSRAHPGWREVIGFPDRGRWLAEIRTSVGFGLLLYPAMVLVVGLVVSLVLEVVSGHAVPAPEQVPKGLSTVGAVVTAVYAIGIAPIHEELFFRGILFRGVRDRYGLLAGFLATGTAFSLIHYIDGPWQGAVLLMGVMFFNGMALAWWYERRGTIVASVVAHMVFNVIGIVLIFGTR
jgi:membrane protease YdiL (CAAX protease family)